MRLQKRADIERFVRRPDAAIRAAVIHGRDLALVGEMADILAASVTADVNDPFSVSVLSDSELLARQDCLEGELSAVSMTGGRRLVRLRLTNGRASLDKIVLEALEGHLAGRLNPEAFFLVESSSLERGSGLRKLAETARDCAELVCYDDESADLLRLLREQLTQNGVHLTVEALDQLATRLPRDRGVARREIERLCLFIGPDRNAPTEAAELINFFGVEPEAILSDAAFDAFGGRASAAHDCLRRSAQEGESGVSAIRALSFHAARLRKVAALQTGGADAQTAAKSVGIFWKNEREFLRQCRAWKTGGLAGVQRDILTADRACKQSGSPDHLIAERLVLAIALRARHAGL